VVVDNRGGAGGQHCCRRSLRKPAGRPYPVHRRNGPNAVNPSLIKNLPYDSQSAFAPITLTATNNLLLAVPLSLPVKSVKELIELARSKPGQLRYGSPGTGSSPHLAGELFKALAAST